MQATFLLGPAGSGKTHRCLSEIRDALLASPEGLPLVFLAPKQATFQLERELLADPHLPGYTRLQIVAFDTLAELVLSHFFSIRSQVLRDEGRVMVLRALLAHKHEQLRLFHTTARLPGFARQLSALINELQRHQVTPAQLSDLAARAEAAGQLPEKLHDLALLFQAYTDWLDRNDLQDPNRLLDLAAAEVRQAAREGLFHLGGLWLDGFSDITPRELEFLAALIPCCERATLAFCLDQYPVLKPGGSAAGALVARTFHRCYERLAAEPGGGLTIEQLPRRAAPSRFASSPVLRHLEQHWADPAPFAASELGLAENIGPGEILRILRCPNPEAEAAAAAREILKHTRDRGGRFRETAVLVRSLDHYHHVVRRVFTRYEIPFFIDRREPIAHHPLAELTRYALRLVLQAWDHDDWFGALKTGLVSADDSNLDRLENEALARGWRGEQWRRPLVLEGKPELTRWAESLRGRLVPAFDRFVQSLKDVLSQPTGVQLAEAIRALWRDLRVAETLRRWSESAVTAAASPQAMLQAQIHLAALEELHRWLNNLELAFAATAMPLGDWLPVVEAGLANLTAGVIPLALDEVLVGAVDRSRNPNVRLVLVLGLNETEFPKAPAPAVLLNEPDREALAGLGLVLDPPPAEQLLEERYLGYIACTRARERLLLTYAQRDPQDKPLNPSAFIDHLQRLFPTLREEDAAMETDWRQSAHASEVVAPLLRNRLRPPGQFNHSLAALEELPAFQPIIARWLRVSSARTITRLTPGLPRRLYGLTLETSISHLEEYAACPFKFFVIRGLRAEERQQFETDPRERGSFQHEVLMEFHRRLQARSQRWRDLTLEEARDWITQIGEELRTRFRDGLFDSTAERRFTAGLLLERLRRLIGVLVHWSRQYAFEPRAVEIGFGLEEGGLAPWHIDLGEERALCLRGRIDRVDVLPGDSPDSAYIVVIDYKSSGQELKPVKLTHGLDLQLLAYLAVLQDAPDATTRLGSSKLIPAGAFYVSLRGGASAGRTRRQVLADPETARREGYKHRGRFRHDLLLFFDNRGERRGDQFNYLLNQDGSPRRNTGESLPAGEFAELLAEVRRRLQQYGQEIFEGKVAVEPYRIHGETPCEHCGCRAICRFDPWVEPYRVLRSPARLQTAATGTEAE